LAIVNKRNTEEETTLSKVSDDERVQGIVTKNCAVTVRCGLIRGWKNQLAGAAAGS